MWSVSYGPASQGGIWSLCFSEIFQSSALQPSSCGEARVWPEAFLLPLWLVTAPAPPPLKPDCSFRQQHPPVFVLSPASAWFSRSQTTARGNRRTHGYPLAELSQDLLPPPPDRFPSHFLPPPRLLHLCLSHTVQDMNLPIPKDQSHLLTRYRSGDAARVPLSVVSEQNSWLRHKIKVRLGHLLLVALVVVFPPCVRQTSFMSVFPSV